MELRVSLSENGEQIVDQFGNAVSAQHLVDYVGELRQALADESVGASRQRIRAVKAESEALCDICTGDGKLNCACGGTGKAIDAVQHLRKELFAIRERAKRMHKFSQGDCRKAHVHKSGTCVFCKVEALERRQRVLTSIIINLIRRGSYSIAHKKNGTSMIMDSRSWLVRSIEFNNTDDDLIEKLIELQSAR